ncbi:hypothetical protein HYQ46_001803 [Verticillium longisporum]|nr:hypothetical protein HYQ46_001803 [Verticillium longisporum]
MQGRVVHGWGKTGLAQIIGCTTIVQSRLRDNTCMWRPSKASTCPLNRSTSKLSLMVVTGLMRRTISQPWLRARCLRSTVRYSGTSRRP